MGATPVWVILSTLLSSLFVKFSQKHKENKMSYRCQQCECQVECGQEQKKVVTEKRKKTYETEDGHFLGDGWEIAKELSVCGGCEEKLCVGQ